MVRKSKGSIVVEVSRQKNPGRVGLHNKPPYEAVVGLVTDDSRDFQLQA